MEVWTGSPILAATAVVMGFFGIVSTIGLVGLLWEGLRQLIGRRS